MLVWDNPIVHGVAHTETGYIFIVKILVSFAQFLLGILEFAGSGEVEPKRADPFHPLGHKTSVPVDRAPLDERGENATLGQPAKKFPNPLKRDPPGTPR